LGGAAAAACVGAADVWWVAFNIAIKHQEAGMTLPLLTRLVILCQSFVIARQSE